MRTRAIDAARDYIRDARDRGIGAVSTAAVAKRLNVTEDQAIALLNCLVETEGLVTIHGCVSCPVCLEQIDLRGSRLTDLAREAERLAGTPCPFCGVPLPGAHDSKIQLSFFCRAVVPQDSGTTAQNASTTVTATATPTTTVDLAQLKDIQGIQCENLIIATSGSTVMLGETVSQASAGGVVAGIASGTHAAMRDVVAGGRDVDTRRTLASVPPASPAAQAEKKSAPGYLGWSAISVSLGLLVGLGCWLFLPTFKYRNALIAAASLAAMVVAFRLNPLLWTRWLIGVVVVAWLGAAALGFSGKLFGDIPGLAKFEIVVDSAPPAATFHIAVALVVGFLLVYDFLQRRVS